MNEKEFHLLADATLASVVDATEQADEEGKLEVDYEAGVVTIEIPGGKQFIINKHLPTMQLWLSSPVSGGLHFSADQERKEWILSDGRTLRKIITEELLKLTNLNILL